MIDDETVQQFMALFGGRADAVGRLAANGRAFQEKTLVDFATYRAHLTGTRWPSSSLGIYPLVDGGMVQWACCDIDLGDEASAWRVADALESFGARPLVERSKSKGHHVWVFFGAWVGAYAARRLLLQASQDSGVRCEIFPKQDDVTADSPYGNFVHLPYPGHPDAAGGRYFIERSGDALTLHEFLNAVEVTDLPAWATERAPSRRSTVDRLTRGTYAGHRAPCIQACLDGSVRAGYRNEALIRVAGYLANTEHAPDAEQQTVSAAMRWGLAEREAQATFRSAQERGIWYGCDKKREVPEMAAACTYEACPFHRSATRERHGATFVLSRSTPLPDPDPVPPDGVNELAEAELLELIAPSGFLRHYVDYATPLSDAPPVGHLAAALVLVASTLGNRVFMRGFSGNVLRPNVWIVFMAPSGARKSSIMTKAISFLLRLPRGAELLLSNKASIEQWLAELAVQPSRLLHADEFMALYQRFNRDIMSEARSDLTELFATNYKVYSTKKDGVQIIRNPALSLLAGCTPAELEQHVRKEHFASGFLARILWLPARYEATAPDMIPPIEPHKEAAILTRLQWIQTISGEITFGPAVDRRLATWSKEFRARERDNAGAGIGLVNRAFDFAGKFAMLLQVSESEPGTDTWRELDPDVVERAIRLTEWIVKSAIRFIQSDLADSDHERDVRLVLAAVRKAGGVIGRRELRRAIRHLKGRDFDAVVDQLLDGDEIEQGEQVTTGRKAVVYRLTGQKPLPSTSVPPSVPDVFPDGDAESGLPSFRPTILHTHRTKREETPGRKDGSQNSAS